MYICRNSTRALAIFSGPKDPGIWGLRTKGPGDPGTRIGIHCTVHIHIRCLLLPDCNMDKNSGMDYGMDYGIDYRIFVYSTWHLFVYSIWHLCILCSSCFRTSDNIQLLYWLIDCISYCTVVLCAPWLYSVYLRDLYKPNCLLTGHIIVLL